MLQKYNTIYFLEIVQGKNGNSTHAESPSFRSIYAPKARAFFLLLKIIFVFHLNGILHTGHADIEMFLQGFFQT